MSPRVKPRSRNCSASRNTGNREQTRYAGTMASPARTTRNDAIVTGGRYRRPTFAAMKFTAHTTPPSPIEPAIPHRPGARPADFSTYTASGQPFFANRQFFNGVQPRLVSDSRTRRHANGSSRRNRDFRLDDVFMPITAACSHISRQREIWAGGYRNVVRAPDPRFQHTAAPHRHLARLAKIMDFLRNRVPAHAPHL